MLLITLIFVWIILILAFLLFVYLFLHLFVELFFTLFKKYAPFVPTVTLIYRQEFEELFKFLESLNLENKKFVDLGSGDGVVVKKFAEKGYQSYGIEGNPFLFFLSKLGIKNKNAFFIRSDFFKEDLRNFGIVYVYQLTSINQKLLPKLQEELKSGSIIIAHKFPFFESEQIKLIKKINGNTLLIYQKL